MTASMAGSRLAPPDGAFSGTRGIQGDGLIRGHDGDLYAVFYGSGSVARYGDDGSFRGYLVDPGGGLTRANHIILIPGPPAAGLAGVGVALSAVRRRRR